MLIKHSLHFVGLTDLHPFIFQVTIEGQCQTTYTVNKNEKRGQQAEQQEGQQAEAQQISLFNVTKSIDFKQCRQVSDIAFGWSLCFDGSRSFR